MAGEKHVILKNGSCLFLFGPLERPDRVEAVREIGFSAQEIAAGNRGVGDER
jgi:hypothetical protein